VVCSNGLTNIMKLAEISGFIHQKLIDTNYQHKEQIPEDLIDIANHRYNDKEIHTREDITFIIFLLNFTKVPLNIMDYDYSQNKEKIESKI